MMTYQGPERRMMPPDLISELQALHEAIGVLADQMGESLPEQRMQELVTAAIAEEKRGRVRLIVAVVSPLMIVLAVALATLAQSSANHRQGQRIQQTSQDAKVVGDYVRGCIQAPVTQRDPAQCGPDTGMVIIKGLLGSINCSLLIEPTRRTEENLNACTTRAFTAGTR